MKQKFFHPHLDFFGFSASILCAVHCMAIPLLLTLGTLRGLAWLQNPWTEAIFIGLSFGIATWALTRSYLLHHYFTAIRMVAVGFGFLLLSRFVEPAWEPMLAAVGGITIAASHWKNWQLQTRRAMTSADKAGGHEKCSHSILKS